MPGKGNYTVLDGAPTTVIKPAQMRDMFIVNTGLTTVYLAATTADCTQFTGLPLTAGATKQWLAGDECYAITATGTSGTINLSDNAGNLTDPSAIGQAIYVSGIPAVDKRTLVYTTGGDVGTAFFGTKVDVSAYRTLQFYTSQAVFGPPAPTAYQVTIDWYTSLTAAIPVWRDSYFMGGTNDGNGAIIPVKGTVFRIRTDAGSGQATTLVYGSYSEAKQQYSASGAGIGSSGFLLGSGYEGMQRWVGTLPVSTTWLWEPDVLTGPTRLVFRCGSAGPHTVNILIRSKLSTLAVYDSSIGLAAVTNTQVKFDWLNPAEPYEISIENTSAANTCAFRFVLMYQNPWGF